MLNMANCVDFVSKKTLNDSRSTTMEAGYKLLLLNVLLILLKENYLIAYPTVLIYQALYHLLYTSGYLSA